MEGWAGPEDRFQWVTWQGGAGIGSNVNVVLINGPPPP